MVQGSHFVGSHVIHTYAAFDPSGTCQFCLTSDPKTYIYGVRIKSLQLHKKLYMHVMND